MLSGGRVNGDRLVDELCSAPMLTPQLIFRIVADACTRVPNLTRAGKAARLRSLVLAEAWTDTALWLVEAELPAWRPRRLVHDGGEWICSLSRHPEVPIEFDDTADGRHEEQPIAILLSFVEAKRLLAASAFAHPPSVPQVRPAAAYPLCCENFR